MTTIHGERGHATGVTPWPLAAPHTVHHRPPYGGGSLAAAAGNGAHPTGTTVRRGPYGNRKGGGGDSPWGLLPQRT